MSLSVGVGDIRNSNKLEDLFDTFNIEEYRSSCIASVITVTVLRSRSRIGQLTYLRKESARKVERDAFQ